VVLLQSVERLLRCLEANGRLRSVDGEDPGQPAASDIAAECETLGITFQLIPIDRNGLTMDMVEGFRSAVATSEGHVLAYCRSGQRSSVLWQASGSP